MGGPKLEIDPQEIIGTAETPLRGWKIPSRTFLRIFATSSRRGAEASIGTGGRGINPSGTSLCAKKSRIARI
jgi:hypothetical protein